MARPGPAGINEVATAKERNGCSLFTAGRTRDSLQWRLTLSCLTVKSLLLAELDRLSLVSAQNKKYVSTLQLCPGISVKSLLKFTYCKIVQIEAVELFKFELRWKFGSS